MKIIELNGKRYDASMGRLLDNAAPARARTNHQPTSLPVPQEVKKAITARHGQHPVQPHKPERARTLMRHVVKKPQTKPAKTSSKHSAPILYGNLSLQRQKRAAKIDQSPLISHFNQHRPALHKKIAVLPVQTPPQPDDYLTEPAHTPTVLPKHSAEPDAIRQALEHANSHRQPRLKKTRLHHRAAHRLGVSPHHVNLAGASLVLILVMGFVAYQNTTGLAMHVAASRAGFQARLPRYQPAGFHMDGPIQAANGLVILKFKSTSDQRSFRLNQQPSNWTSQALFNKVVSQRPHYTYQGNGQIIYIYDQSNATWVNNGIWYTIEGDSNLNSEQLLQIANNI